MVAQVKAKYTGPGADNFGGKVYPGQLSMLDQIENFAAAPLGTAPLPGRQNQNQENGGLLVLGPTPLAVKGPNQFTVGLYDSRLTPSSTALYDFSDPNCFPPAATATAGSQPVVDTQVISDLATYIYGSQASGANRATPYPNGTVAASSIALSYQLSPLADPGIPRTGLVLSLGGQAISLSPTTNTSVQKPYATAATFSCMWFVAFETLATVISTATESAIFTIGQTLAALQFALTTVNGNLNCYVNGTLVPLQNWVLAANTRYTVAVHFTAVDPNNPFNYLVEIFVNNVSSGAISIPWSPLLTPWTYANNGSVREIIQSDGTCQFGPSAAFGSAVWEFLALGYIFEDYGNEPISGYVPFSLDNSTYSDIQTHVTSLSTSFGVL